MMYDHEKSAPAIVAVKPTNKAGQPAAELAEPRAGAEGNVSQQSTGRAQYRETVSQALARIRQVARQRKKEAEGTDWKRSIDGETCSIKRPPSFIDSSSQAKGLGP